MERNIEDYQGFTTPAQLHKSINTLRGIVAGITADAKLETNEMHELIHWCQLHSHLRTRHPFSELLPAMEKACADGTISDDKAQDILWLCNNFTDNSSYYDTVTSSIQFLSGMLKAYACARGQTLNGLMRQILWDWAKQNCAADKEE